MEKIIHMKEVEKVLARGKSLSMSQLRTVANGLGQAVRDGLLEALRDGNSVE